MALFAYTLARAFAVKRMRYGCSNDTRCLSSLRQLANTKESEVYISFKGQVCL